MLNKFWRVMASFALVRMGWSLILAIALFLETAVSPAFAQELLPQPDPEFNGKIGVTYKTSSDDKGLFKAVEAEEGAPNILLVWITGSLSS